MDLPNFANTSDDTVQEILRQYNQLYSDRGVWEVHWQEIAERILPNDIYTFQNNFRTAGQKRTYNVFDSTGQLALTRFAAIMDSLLTPRNQKWHRLVTNDKTLNNNREVQLYLEEVNNLLFKYRYAPMANFASQNQQNYTSLGAYGTGCMFTDQLDGRPGIRYRNIFLGELYFAENHQGIIDKVFRHFKLSARAAYQKWGDKLPAEILNTLKTYPENLFEFVHAVIPRKEFDPNRKDFRGMPWESHYISLMGQKGLTEGGYRTFPYSPSRYTQSLGEVYGRSPAMDVLPAIKTLNEEKKTILKAGHRAVDPVILAHDDGVLSSFSLAPGAVNYGGVNADGRQLIHTLPVGNFEIGKELMDDERNLIKDSFLVSVFQILQENPQMTATEVMERTREKGILLAPTVGRQQSEYLGPMIEREIDVLAQQGLLPPMPRMLREMGGEYSMEYDSPISRSQRAEEMAGVQRVLESLLPIVQATANPEPLDYFDWDVITPQMMDISAVPKSWVKNMDAVNKIRQGRQQQAAAEQMIKAGPAAASMVKAVGTPG